MRSRGNGGLIGALNAPNRQHAYGVWSCNDAAQFLAGATQQWPYMAADPSYASTVGLWDFDGFTNSIFPDTSFVGTNTVTLGSSFGALDDAHTKFNNKYSFKKYAGNVGAASAATATGFNFGTGDYTIEGWFYTGTFTGTNQVVIDMRISTEPSVRPLIYFANNGVINFYLNGAARISSASSTIAAGNWYHWHVSKISGSTQMGINGSQVGSTYTDGNTYTQGNVLFGCDYPGSAGFTGWFGPHRITKGVGRYSGTYTTPTAPFAPY
jgi:hypothetical protein